MHLCSLQSLLHSHRSRNPDCCYSGHLKCLRKWLYVKLWSLFGLNHLLLLEPAQALGCRSQSINHAPDLAPPLEAKSLRTTPRIFGTPLMVHGLWRALGGQPCATPNPCLCPVPPLQRLNLPQPQTIMTLELKLMCHHALIHLQLPLR